MKTHKTKQQQYLTLECRETEHRNLEKRREKERQCKAAMAPPSKLMIRLHRLAVRLLQLNVMKQQIQEARANAKLDRVDRADGCSLRHSKKQGISSSHRTRTRRKKIAEHTRPQTKSQRGRLAKKAQDRDRRQARDLKSGKISGKISGRTILKLYLGGNYAKGKEYTLLIQVADDLEVFDYFQRQREEEEDEAYLDYFQRQREEEEDQAYQRWLSNNSDSDSD